MVHEPEVMSGMAKVRHKNPDGTWPSTEERVHWGRCPCGWGGPRRTRHDDADDDCVQHRIYADD